MYRNVSTYLECTNIVCRHHRFFLLNLQARRGQSDSIRRVAVQTNFRHLHGTPEAIGRTHLFTITIRILGIVFPCYHVNVFNPSLLDTKVLQRNEMHTYRHGLHMAKASLYERKISKGEIVNEVLVVFFSLKGQCRGYRLGGIRRIGCDYSSPAIV